MNNKYTFVFLLLILCRPVLAHDPVFSLGPHTLYKGGLELALQANQSEQGAVEELEYALNLGYGITSNWEMTMSVPYAEKTQAGDTESGWSDILLVTKYRLMRNDELGVQTSAAILFGASLENGESGEKFDIGNNAVDSFLAVTYGYESRQWYRWASTRYWRFGEAAGFRLGSAWYFDYAWGYRATKNGYRNQDWLALFEVNTEFHNRDELKNEEQLNSGGVSIFATPGFAWSYRNLSIKAGIQIPAYEDLNEQEDSPEKRIKILIQWRI